MVGRKETVVAANAFLDGLRAAAPGVELIWIEGEVALLADVKRICGELAGRETALDMLYLSAGYVPFSGRAGM